MRSPISSSLNPVETLAVVPPPEPSFKPFDLDGISRMRLFFSRRRAESESQRDKISQMLPASIVALALTMATMFSMSENMNRTTLGSMAFALLVAIVTIIAIWSGDEHFHVIHRLYSESPSIDAIEIIYSAEVKMLHDDDSGWHTLEVKSHVIPLDQAVSPVPDSPRIYSSIHQQNMAVSDTMKILLLSGMGLLLSGMLSATGPELEIKLANKTIEAPRTIAAPELPSAPEIEVQLTAFYP